MPSPFRVVAVPVSKRVNTMRGSQVHRGFAPVVYFPGEPKPVRVPSFHQKRKSAIETGERYARKALRERAAEKAETDPR